MSVDKPLRTPDAVLADIAGPSGASDAYGVPPAEAEEIEIQIDGMESADEALTDGSVITEMPDGGVEISDAPATDGEPSGHDENLALTLSEDTQAEILAEALDALQADLGSRSDWENMAARGFSLLGMKIEDRNDPWENACGVYHPMLLEAVIRFWAKACKDLCPAAGPAKAKILGQPSPEATRKANRIKEEINHIITDEIPGYRSEQSRMVFILGLLGAGFKKIWFDESAGVIQDKYVHPQDLIAPYNTTDLKTCPRFCHRTRMFASTILSLMEAGVYKKVSLQEVTAPTVTEIDQKHNDISGERPSSKGGQHEILEYYMDLQIPGLPESADGKVYPYCVTIDKNQEQILAIRRHWEEGDPKFKRVCYFTAYQYIPGFSIYSVGLVHLIGSLAEGATQILRQLVDAGTLSNLPAGFKTKSFRIKGDDRPLRPGEFRDVDIPGAKIADSIMPLPFKEPSAVLAGLLEALVTEGRRVGSVADVSASDISSETPVGTTLALLEESLVIQSSIQTNLLDALGDELETIKKLVMYLPAEYQYAVSDGANRHDDFADARIVPVADPNASSMAQKVVAYQELINLSAMAPEVYNKAKLHRGMGEALQIPGIDEIIPLEEDIKPADPVTENMNILRGTPTRVFAWQDHEAHLQVHMAAMMDPRIQELVGQSPSASAINGAAMSHINEHVAWAYRARIEAIMGEALPDPDQPMTPEIEHQAAPRLAEAAKQLLGQSQKEAAMQKAQEAMADPVFKLQEKELEIKEMDQVRKATTDAAKIEADVDKAKLTAQVELLKLMITMKDNEREALMDEVKRGGDLQSNTALELLRMHNQRETNRETLASQERQAALRPKPASK